MRIDYHGNRTDLKKQRTVYIRFNREKEEELVDYVFEYLENAGYQIEEENDIARVYVSSREEYKKIMEICKQLRLEQEGHV